MKRGRSTSWPGLLQLAWQAPARAEAKRPGEAFAAGLSATGKKAPGGRAAPRVKAGKGRRHGGYGI